MDIVEDLLAAGIGLGEALHVIDELTRHRVSFAFLSEISGMSESLLADARVFRNQA